MASALGLGRAVLGVLRAVHDTLHCGEVVKAPILSLLLAVEVANAIDRGLKPWPMAEPPSASTNSNASATEPQIRIHIITTTPP